MSDGMSMSSAIDRFLDKLRFIFAVGSIASFIIVIFVIIIIFLMKRADKKDPSGNAKRILKQKVIGTLAGILIIMIYNFLPNKLFHNNIILIIIPTTVVAIMACIFGPFAGCIIGLFGHIIGELIQSDYHVLIWLKNYYFYLPIGLYGFVIGILWKKCTLNINEIPIQKVIIFCIIQILCNIILCYGIFFIPDINLFISYLKERIIYFLIETIIIGVTLCLYIKLKKNNVGFHCT